MKKIIAILLTLCLLSGLCGFAAAEEEPLVLEFPYTGFTFTVPDFISKLPGMIRSVDDYGETQFGSGIFYGSLTYLPRTEEESEALIQVMGEAPDWDNLTEEQEEAYDAFMAPMTSLFIVIGIAEGKSWEKDVVPLFTDGADGMMDPVKIGERDGYTYYVTASKRDSAWNRQTLEPVDPDLREGFLDAVEETLLHPELFTLTERDTSRTPPEPGEQVSFEAKGLEGNSVSVSDLTAGSKVTIVFYWQTFCGPCKAEMPELDRLAEEYGDKGLNVVGCVCDAVNENKTALAVEIAGEHRFRAVKVTKEMAAQLPYNGTPTTYFLDGEGRVLDYPISGAIPEDYRTALEDYLNGKTPEFQALLKQKVDAKETPAQPEGDQTYTVVFVDEEGNPVPEVMAAFCTADKCHQTESDEEGKCTYTGPADSYHVTIVEVPDGFKDDFNDDVYTEKYSGGSITIVLRKE